jgi:hypothetical protein
VPVYEMSGRVGGRGGEGSVGKRIDFAWRALCWPRDTAAWFLDEISWADLYKVEYNRRD